MDSVRWEVWFTGRVQGVGFRASTVEIARDFPVTGSVRNLGDGRVHLIAEGEPDELKSLVAAILVKRADAVTHVEQTESPATGQFASFGMG